MAPSIVVSVAAPELLRYTLPLARLFTAHADGPDVSRACFVFGPK